MGMEFLERHKELVGWNGEASTPFTIHEEEGDEDQHTVDTGNDQSGSNSAVTEGTAEVGVSAAAVVMGVGAATAAAAVAEEVEATASTFYAAAAAAGRTRLPHSSPDFSCVLNEEREKERQGGGNVEEEKKGGTEQEQELEQEGEEGGGRDGGGEGEGRSSISASLSDTWGASDGSGWESLGGTRWGVSANTPFPTSAGSIAPSPEATNPPNPARPSSFPLQPQRDIWQPSETRPIPLRPPVVGLLPLLPFGTSVSGSVGPPPPPPTRPPPRSPPPLPLLPYRRTGEEGWGGLPRASAFAEREGGYAEEDPGAGCGNESAVVEVGGVVEVVEGGVEKEEEHEEEEEVQEKYDDKQEVEEQEMEEVGEQEMEMEQEIEEGEQEEMQPQEQEQEEDVGDAGGAGSMRASLDDTAVSPPATVVAAVAAEVEGERFEGDADEQWGTGEGWRGLAAVATAAAAQGSCVTRPGGGSGLSTASMKVSVEAGQAGGEGACWPERCASPCTVLGASGQGEPPPSLSSGSGGGASAGGDGGGSVADLEGAFGDIGDDSPAVRQPEHIDGGGEEAPGEFTAEYDKATAAATTTATAIIEEETHLFSQPSVPFLGTVAVSETPAEPPADGSDGSDRAEQEDLVTALPSVGAVVKGFAARQEDGGVERWTG